MSKGREKTKSMRSGKPLPRPPAVPGRESIIQPAVEPLTEALSVETETLGPEVAKLRRKGTPFGERVLFCADASVEPGRTIVVHRLLSVMARRRLIASSDVDGMDAQARAAGKAFYVTMMLKPEVVMQLVEVMAAPTIRASRACENFSTFRSQERTPSASCS